MVLKKLLGFATTTSLILLVMVAPTTTSLQQEDNVTATDEPDIPTGPKEVDKLPILEEPIPDNENETDDDEREPVKACTLEILGTEECRRFLEDDDGYDEDECWAMYDIARPLPDYPPECQQYFEPYREENFDSDPCWDAFNEENPTDFEQYTTECERYFKIYYAGRGGGGSTEPLRPPPPANDTGGVVDTWINSVRDPAGKNIPNGGSTSSKVVTVDFQSTATDTGKGSHVDLKIDIGRYDAVASPKTITDLSVGKHTIYLKGVDKYGNEDPTPAKWTFTVKQGKGGLPETWINWVRATAKGVNIANGGSTSSSTVIVDFQGTVSGRGSHIDLKIDNGPYEPVASRHKIPWLSDGTHTIYLKAVDKDGKADPTPAKWRFTVR
jgi:hypothetical protein